MTFVFDRTIFYLDNYLNNRKEGGWSMAFAETFKALSDPERRKILELLKAGPMSAGEIASNFDTTGATISYHLKVLKKANLIFETKEKKLYLLSIKRIYSGRSYALDNEFEGGRIKC